MKTRLWKVEFGINSTRVVKANNAKEAIKKATNKRNRTLLNQNLHDITIVELVAEEEYYAWEEKK